MPEIGDMWAPTCDKLYVWTGEKWKLYMNEEEKSEGQDTEKQKKE